jgi:hypothetical protein
MGVLALLLAACTHPRIAKGSDAGSSPGMVRGRAPVSYWAILHAYSPLPLAITAGRAGSGAVEIKAPASGRIEYRLTLDNPGSELFTEGVLVHATEDGGDEVVGTLFADAGLRDRRINIRGSLALPRPVDAVQLAAEIRSNPTSFRVLVRSVQAPAGAWEGRLRDGGRSRP